MEIKKTLLLLCLIPLLLSNWTLPAPVASNTGQQQVQQDTTLPSIFDLLSTEGITDLALQTDYKQLFKTSDEEKPPHQPARLSFKDEAGNALQWDVEVRLRGKRRKKYCHFPPLKIRFSKSDLNARGLNPRYHTIKLVTHCKKGKTYLNLLMREYLAYQIYSLLTDKSYRTTFKEINYVGTGGKVEKLGTYTFLIEHPKQMADRAGGIVFEDKKYRLANVQNELTTHADVFQYLIGNSDYKIDGLHNVDLVQFKNSPVMYAVPFDFDYSGFVNAHYAVPSPWSGIKEITERAFLGFCDSEPYWEQVIQNYLDHKEEIYALIQNFPHLEKRCKRELTEYLDSFYDLMNSPVRTKFEFKRTCFQPF